METPLSPDPAAVPEVQETPAPPPEVPKEDLLQLARAAASLLEGAPGGEAARVFQSVVEWDTRQDSGKVAQLAEELDRCVASEAVQKDPAGGLVLRTIRALVASYRECGRWSPASADVGSLAALVDHLAGKRSAVLFDEESDCLTNWKSLEGRCAAIGTERPEGLPDWMSDQKQALLERVQRALKYLTEWQERPGPLAPAPEELLDLFLWQASLPVPKQEADPAAWRALVDAYGAWSLCVLQTLRLLKERGVTVTVPIPMSDRFDAQIHEMVRDPFPAGSGKESERIKEVHKLGFSSGGSRQKARVTAFKRFGVESGEAPGSRF
ncbi:MAG: hypothetical protein ACK41F_04385 [Fimbriimonadaceae bacterium]